MGADERNGEEMNEEFMGGFYVGLISGAFVMWILVELTYYIHSSLV
jgi:hypothetical protein